MIKMRLYKGFVGICFLLWSAALPVLSSAQKKPFDASAAVSADLLNGPTSTGKAHLKSVILDKSVFGSVAAKADVETGQVRRMEGLIKLPAGDTPRQSVDSFLKENAEIFGEATKNGNLKLLRQTKSPTGEHFYYQQLFQGRPLWGGSISVHNVVGSKAAKIINDLRELSTAQALPSPKNTEFNDQDKAKAIEIAQGAVKYKKLSPAEPTVEPGFLDVQGQPVAVWRVRYSTSEPGAAWEVMVRAADLQAISARNAAVYATDSKASVFYADPVGRTGNLNLTFPLSPQDPLVNLLQGARFPVVLTELDGKGMLDGRYATTNLTSAFTRANSSTLDFTYDWDDPHFREAMAYYWVTECAHYLQQLGFGQIFQSSIAINVDGTPDDNSWYRDGTLTFGSGGVPDAEDAEVIFHELGHAIQDAQVPGLLNDGGDEVRAVSEGFGDYWAASYFAGLGPKGVAWDVFFDKWDGITAHPAKDGNPPYLRRIDSSKKYPKDLDHEVHDDGEIWSACLWKIRKILGKDQAAKVILESNFQLVPSSTFPDAANAVLAANQALNAGRNALDIRRVFEDSGILPPTRSSKVPAKSKK